MSETQDPYALERSAKADGLRHILGCTALAIPSTSPANLGVDKDKAYDNPYGRLAERLYSGFLQSAEEAGGHRYIVLAAGPTVLHGFYVMTRLLQWGPTAYKNDVLANNPDESVVTSVTNLGGIMSRSAGVMVNFANRGDDTNGIYEASFGLRASAPYYEPMPFSITSSESDRKMFRASPWSAAVTELRLGYLAADAGIEHEDYKSCAAMGAVLNATWQEAVTTCVIEPDLYLQSFMNDAPPPVA